MSQKAEMSQKMVTSIAKDGNIAEPINQQEQHDETKTRGTPGVMPACTLA